MEFTFLADLSNVLRNYQTDAMKPYYFNQIFISTTYPNNISNTFIRIILQEIISNWSLQRNLVIET